MMDLYISFPVSGVETLVFLPPLVAFVVSFFTSMGGISGAFLLLPYQISILNFHSPSVSSTNFVYNIVAIPSGVYRYIREGRMAWPLAWTIIGGTLPGVFFGYYIRVSYLPNPQAFRLFVGCVLLYIGGRLLYEIFGKSPWGRTQMESSNHRIKEPSKMPGIMQDRLNSANLPSSTAVRTLSCTLKAVKYEFFGKEFSFSVPAMLILAFIVGIVGGAYGIGGGSIIAPFCVTLFELPVYTVAGAALMGTFVTSIAGVFFYSMIPVKAGISTAPDWPLGILFGLGGFVGMYCGAWLQRFVPQRLIKAILGAMMLFLSASYIIGFFAG